MSKADGISCIDIGVRNLPWDNVREWTIWVRGIIQCKHQVYRACGQPGLSWFDPQLLLYDECDDYPVQRCWKIEHSAIHRRWGQNYELTSPSDGSQQPALLLLYVHATSACMLFLWTCPSKLSCRCRGCCARMHHAYVSSSSPDRVLSCYERRTQHSVLSSDNQQHVNKEAWLLQPRDEEPSSLHVLHGRSSSLWWLYWQDCMSLPVTSRGNERFTGISCNSAAAILD